MNKNLIYEPQNMHIEEVTLPHKEIHKNIIIALITLFLPPNNDIYLQKMVENTIEVTEAIRLNHSGSYFLKIETLSNERLIALTNQLSQISTYELSIL